MEFRNYVLKITLFLVLGVLSILSMNTFADNPSFSVSPATLTGKLYCNYIFKMVLTPGGMGYNGFQSTIKFASGNILITPIAVNALFNGVTATSITDWFLYEAYGTMAPWQFSTSPVDALTFWFKTLQNLTSTNLTFTNITGGPITFDKNTTDDGAVINSNINSLDILTWVNDWAYTFVALPCIPDATAPGMWRNTPINGQRYIPSNYTVSFVLYDRAWPGTEAGIAPMSTNNRQHYRYSWFNTTVLSNYQPAPATVDNQEWVNSGTISVTVACPTCLTPWTYTTPAIPSLDITERTGDAVYNKITRQNKTRWYLVSFPAPSPYEIEKQVNVNISVTDNSNENNQTHTGTPSFSFNAPINPTITRNAPGNTNVPTNFNAFSFTFSDDWAGVDTWTISITIPQFSSWSKFYTWYTYSGSDLIITLLNWAPGAGNSW